MHNLLLTSLSASRGSTFLKPRQEDINKLIEYGVTDADLRMAGIPRRIGDLTSNEVQELIRLAKPQREGADKQSTAVRQSTLEGREGTAQTGVHGAVPSNYNNNTSEPEVEMKRWLRLMRKRGEKVVVIDQTGKILDM